MYTVIPRQEVQTAPSQQGEPSPIIIDHRQNQDRKTSKWKNRRRQEQLPYDTLREHRDNLLNAEFKYKQKIKELEKQSEELTQTFEQTVQENRTLRSIIEHGPDAVKLKKLQNDRKEQKSTIDTLKEENDELREKIKELEKVYGAPVDFANEKNWKEALAKAKKKREEEDAIPTQGPFAGAKILKPKRIAINDDRSETQDTYDLELDTVEKETQVLLNKIRQLKREKGHIDYALTMGKGSVSRNATVANAINDKLNRDLNKFAIRLEKLKLKHKAAKSYKRAVCRSEPNVPIIMSSDEEDNTSDRGAPSPVQKSESDITPRSIQSKPSQLAKGHKVKHIQTVNKNHPKIEVTEKNGPSKQQQDKSSITTERSSIDRSQDSEKIDQKKRIDSLQETNDRKKTTNGEKGKQPRSIKSTSTDKRGNGKGVKTEDNARETDAKNTMGRYSHGPEPIGKTANLQAPKLLETLDAPPIDNGKTAVPKIRFPFTRKAVTKGTLDSRDSGQDSYDAVLEYLRHQSRQQITLDMEDRNGDRENEKETGTLSPIPINFKSVPRTVGGPSASKLMGNTGVRSQEHFHRFL